MKNKRAANTAEKRHNGLLMSIQNTCYVFSMITHIMIVHVLMARIHSCPLRREKTSLRIRLRCRNHASRPDDLKITIIRTVKAVFFTKQDLCLTINRKLDLIHIPEFNQ